jgi:hypothetical protein
MRGREGKRERRERLPFTLLNFLVHKKSKIYIYIQHVSFWSNVRGKARYIYITRIAIQGRMRQDKERQGKVGKKDKKRQDKARPDTRQGKTQRKARHNTVNQVKANHSKSRQANARQDKAR